MGYRSEVIIAVTVANFNKYATQEVKDSLKDCCSVTKAIPDDMEEEVYYFRYDWIKWYSDYPEVRCTEKFIKECDGAMIRIGEEDNDIETVGDCYQYGISIRREIECPAGSEVNESIFACNAVNYIIED